MSSIDAHGNSGIIRSPATRHTPSLETASSGWFGERLAIMLRPDGRWWFRADLGGRRGADAGVILVVRRRQRIDPVRFGPGGRGLVGGGQGLRRVFRLAAAP